MTTTDRRPACQKCGMRIDGTIIPARITEDDFVVYYHYACEPRDD